MFQLLKGRAKTFHGLPPSPNSPRTAYMVAPAKDVIGNTLSYAAGHTF